MADDQCSAMPGVVDRVCVSPGNAEINDSAPVQFAPLLGGGYRGVVTATTERSCVWFELGTYLH
jgi:hypothetical protein